MADSNTLVQVSDNMGKYVHKDIFSISSHGSEESRSKVPGWVDSIATVEAKRDPNPPEQKADHQWLQANLHLRILGVTNGKYTQHQQEGAKNLQTEYVQQERQ